MARPLNDSSYLYGIHDPGGENTMSDAGISGWVLFTEAIGCEPNDTSSKDFGQWSNRGFGILVRINNGYSPGGTLPPASRYADFAKRCGNYVRNSSGAHIWIIGNEMNHPIERPGIRLEGDRLVNPGEAILPGMYANCYRQCRSAIKSQPGHENDQVIVGAVAPWNPNTVYDGNPNGDWCKYLTDILTILGPGNCDGIAIHAYTHGRNPELVYNDYMMNSPFQNRQYNFRVYRDFMQAVPLSMRSLPVYLTETDQNEPWADMNSGWVQRVYGEIDAWNKQPGSQKIRAVILYRWPRFDQWYFEGKQGIIEDFKQSMAHKYNWEQYVQPSEPVQPQPVPTPPQPVPTPPQPVPTPPLPVPVTPIPFPQTGKTAKGAFATFYQRYGADLCGYPITDEYTHSESGLKTQDWQRLVMEEYPADGGQIRLRLIGAEAAELRQKLTELGTQVASLKQQIEQLQQSGGTRTLVPAIIDITDTLPRNAAGFFTRPKDAIQSIVINHTAVRPEIGADRVAQAHLKRWPGILGQFFITGDGQIQQTNPIDQVVADNQSWIFNGINIYVAGNFDEAVPSEKQLASLAQLCAWLLDTYNLPITAIKGAAELVSTQSPGKQWQTGQNWKAMLLEQVQAVTKQVRPQPPSGEDTAALRAQIAALQTQIQSLNGQILDLQSRNTALQAQVDAFKSSAGAQIPQPPITDITQQLPRTPGSLKPRPIGQVKNLVFNHTAVDASVGVDKLAAAHQKRWGAILYHFFISGDGAILQTNPLDQAIDLTQPWLAQGINIAVAGDFTAQIPTDAQLSAAASLSAWLLQELKLPIDAVKGVSEFIASQSPGVQWLQGKKWKGLLTTRIADLQKTAGRSPVSADDPTLSALRSQVQQLQQTLGQAQATISALTDERDQLKAQLAQTPNVAQLTQQIATLGSEKAALGQQVTTLNQQVQTLNAAKTSLTQQVQALTSDKAVLTQQVQTLTSDKAVLTQQVQTLRSQVNPLQQALGQAQATISALTSERDGLRAQLAESTHTGSAPVVPAPQMKDVVDQLPKHAVNRYATRTLDKITHLTIHHSAAPANVPIETIASYHVNTNNWPGIGYHFCVEADGTIYQANRLETISYHVGVANDYTVGICVEGDFRKGATPTPRQIQSTAHLAAWLSQKLSIPVDNIMGHKEYPQNPTECPGDDWNVGQQWKQTLHQRVRAALAGNLAAPVKTIGHYVLFWQRADAWAKEDYTAAANYVARFRPTLGFTPEDAQTAEYVTIVGGPAGVSEETAQKLRNAGCKVERLAGKDFADTQHMLDDLAQRGQRFLTFTV